MESDNWDYKNYAVIKSIDNLCVLKLGLPTKTPHDKNPTDKISTDKIPDDNIPGDKKPKSRNSDKKPTF